MNDDVIQEAEQIANPKPLKPTHCLEILHWLIFHNYEILKVQYIVDGLEAEVRDKLDGINYKLTIKPL